MHKTTLVENIFNWQQWKTKKMEIVNLKNKIWKINLTASSLKICISFFI